MTIYREPPPSLKRPKTRWYHRVTCWLDKHEWVAPPIHWRSGQYVPCAHCRTKLVRHPSPVDPGATYYYTTSEELLR